MGIQITACDPSELEAGALYVHVSITVDGWPVPDERLTVEGCDGYGEAIAAIQRYLDELTCESCSAALYLITGDDSSRAIALITPTSYQYL